MIDKFRGLFNGFFNDKDREESSSKDSIFGDYDIRGEYPKEVNEKIFFQIAISFAKKYEPRKIAIGRDSRRSSLPLTKHLAKGFLDSGIDVIDIGLATSPYCLWISKTKRLDTFMVSASHNPSSQNGLKIYSKKGEAIHGEELRELQDFLLDSKASPVSEKAGKLQHEDYREPYIREIMKIVGDFGRTGKVAVDYMHGTAGVILNRILENKKINFQTLREDPSGDFPKHGPNPLKNDSQKELAHLLKERNYSFGALFDADGDRILFFDENGDVVSVSIVASIFCDYFFSKKGVWRNVVVPVNFSRTIDDTARANKGKVIRSPVGRVNVAPVMRENRSPFGVEVSGHYFFKDFFYYDNSVIAFLTLLKILKEKREPLSDLAKKYTKYATLPEESIPLVPGTEINVMRTVKASFPGWRSDRTDGLTVEYKNWWFNLRQSNTENFWRLSVEAEEEALARDKMEQVVKVIASASSSVKGEE